MNGEEALIIPIRGTQIFYLQREHLNLNFNVSLVSISGEVLRVNHLQLAAFSQHLLIGQDFEGDTIINTNLSYHDLSMVASFITDGILPMPENELKKHVPPDIGQIFTSFGIFLDQVLNKNILLIKKEPPTFTNLDEDKKEIQVKVEQQDLELGDLDQLEHPLPLDDYYDDLIDEAFEAEIEEPVKKTRKRRIKKEKLDSGSEDEEWSPGKSTPKRRSASKKAVIYNDDVNSQDLLFAEPKPKKKYKKREKVDSALSKNERDLKAQCEKFLQDHKDFANLSIPDEANPESKSFELYQLPGDIETFKCPPKKIEKIKTTQDPQHPYPCVQCGGWFNNPYALKNHELLFHSEHYQCSHCKHVSPLNQPDDFKLHMFR